METIKKFMETIQAIIPFIESYPYGVKILIGVWIFLSAITFMALLFVPRNTSNHIPKDEKSMSVKQKADTHQTATKPAQQNITSYNQTGGVTAGQITINNYFDTHSYQTKDYRQKLKNKYPLGYAIFAGDETNVIIPNKPNYANQFDIKWETAKISSLTSDSIGIDMPKIIYKPLNSSIMGMTMTIRRKVGHQRPFPIRFAHQNITPILEMVEDHDKFVVLVLGFK